MINQGYFVLTKHDYYFFHKIKFKLWISLFFFCYSSATHGSRDSKDSAFFTWTAPSSLPSDVILTLILVTRRSSFDDVCNYQALTQTIVASTAAPTTIASITSTSTSIQTTTIDVIVDNCAKYVDLGHRAQCDECFEQLPNDPTLQELENLEVCLCLYFKLNFFIF